MGRRVCFVLDLVDDADLIAEYERAHAPGAAWPEVTAGIRAAGFEAMEIWRAGDRMVMVAEVADDWPRTRPAALADADARWEAAMDRFQKRLSFAAPGEKWVPMTRIFALDAQ
ncbi:L-fucose mutarotase [Sphingomonas metalli]|uniref:L-fucose mutarotase n=1 Tax=Sphingomonas metalli TaxID=1779358 RepID=A0A916T274_9SPHN|nr:L-rhamnose mutarotase [Sphingomonas metalli]GGB26891.1 L-fucose mutarotase [Sphingomonas metalli]